MEQAWALCHTHQASNDSVGDRMEIVEQVKGVFQTYDLTEIYECARG